MSEEPPNTTPENQGGEMSDDQVKYARDIAEDATIGDINAEGGAAPYTMPGHEEELLPEATAETPEDGNEKNNSTSETESSSPEEGEKEESTAEDDSELHIDHEKKADEDSVPEEISEEEPVEEGEDPSIPLWSCKEGEDLLAGRFSEVFVKKSKDGDTLYYGYDPILQKKIAVKEEIAHKMLGGVLEDTSKKPESSDKSSEEAEEKSDNEAEKKTSEDSELVPGAQVEVLVDGERVTALVGSILQGATINGNVTVQVIYKNGEGDVSVKSIQAGNGGRGGDGGAGAAGGGNGGDGGRGGDVIIMNGDEPEDDNGPQDDYQPEVNNPIGDRPAHGGYPGEVRTGESSEPTEAEQESPEQDEDYEDLVAKDLAYVSTAQHPPEPLEKEPQTEDSKDPLADRPPHKGYPGEDEKGGEGETVGPEDMKMPERMVAAETSSTTRGLASEEGAREASEVTSRKGLRGFWDRIKHNFTREGRRMRTEMDFRASGRIGFTPEEEENNRRTAVEWARLAEEGTVALEAENHVEIAKYPGGPKLLQGIEQLVLDANPMTQAELQAQVDRLMADFGSSLHAEDRDRGLSFATNIVDSAMQYKACLSYARGMDNLDEGERLEARLRDQLSEDLAGLKLAELDMGAKSERKSDRVDRVVERLVQNRVVRALFNETSVAVAVGTAYTVGALLLERGGSAALRIGGVALAPVTLGASVVAAQALAAGTVGAIRENRAMFDEQLFMARANARNENVEGGNAKRREQVRETLYETQCMQEVTASLDQAQQDIASGDPARIQAGFRAIAATRARIRVGQDQRVDLFDASSPEAYAAEELQMELALVQAEHVLAQQAASMNDQELRAAGIERDVKAQIERISSHAESIIPEVVLDQSAKDQAFKKLRIKRALRAASVGAVIGAGIGVGLQELRAAIAPDLMGLAEGDRSGAVKTLLAAIVGKEALSGKGGEKAAALLSHTSVGKNSSIAVPNGMKIVEAGQGGGFKVTDGGGNTVLDNLSVDSKGHLTPQSIAELGKHDMKIAEKVQQYTAMEPHTKSVSRSVDQFIGHHRGKFTTVSRDMWYDNNTPGNFDQNELRLTWGSGGTGITEKGNYVFNVSGMTEGGSFHGGASANAPGLVSEGKMMMAISVDKAHQHTPFMVPIDAKGNAIIKADSPLGRALFENQNGQAVFRGAYAEAVQITGHNGGTTVMRPLATEVGSNSVNSIRDSVTTMVPTQHSRVITDIMPMHKETPTEIPFIVPIYARRGIGDIKRDQKKEQKPQEPSGQGEPATQETPPQEPTSPGEPVIVGSPVPPSENLPGPEPYDGGQSAPPVLPPEDEENQPANPTTPSMGGAGGDGGEGGDGIDGGIGGPGGSGGDGGAGIGGGLGGDGGPGGNGGPGIGGSTTTPTDDNQPVNPNQPTNPSMGGAGGDGGEGGDGIDGGIGGPGGSGGDGGAGIGGGLGGDGGPGGNGGPGIGGIGGPSDNDQTDVAAPEQTPNPTEPEANEEVNLEAVTQAIKEARPEQIVEIIRPEQLARLIPDSDPELVLEIVRPEQFARLLKNAKPEQIAALGLTPEQIKRLQELIESTDSNQVA